MGFGEREEFVLLGGEKVEGGGMLIRRKVLE